jgi:hypothetical protein
VVGHHTLCVSRERVTIGNVEPFGGDLHALRLGES